MTYLFHRVPCDVPYGCHGLRLAHTKRSGYGLFLNRWVPLRLYEVHTACRSQRETDFR